MDGGGFHGDRNCNPHTHAMLCDLLNHFTGRTAKRTKGKRRSRWAEQLRWSEWHLILILRPTTTVRWKDMALGKVNMVFEWLLKLFRASAIFCSDCIRLLLLTSWPLTLYTLTAPLHFFNRSTPSGAVLQDLLSGSLEKEGRTALPFRHIRNNAQGVSEVLTSRPPWDWLHIFTRFRHKSRASEEIGDLLICWLRGIRFSYFTVHY